MKNRSIFILSFLLMGSMLVSCSSTRPTSAQRKAEKMEKQTKKENEKLVNDYLKHHYNIQPNETQKMMKSSKKKSKGINSRRKDSWVNRTFNRKRSKNCDGN